MEAKNGSDNSFKNCLKKPKSDENNPLNWSSGHQSPDSLATPRIMNCTWCQKEEASCFTMTTASGSVQSFCTEVCFTLFRRASYKKNRVCDWCKHVRHTVNYVSYKEGMHHLLFCSDKCMNQYKMNVFKNETNNLKAAVDEMVRIGHGLCENRNGQRPPFDPMLISPESWIENQRLQLQRPEYEKRRSVDGEETHSSENVPRMSAVQSLSPSSSPSSGGDRKRKRNGQMKKKGTSNDEASGRSLLQVTKGESQMEGGKGHESSPSLSLLHRSRHQSLSPQDSEEGGIFPGPRRCGSILPFLNGTPPNCARLNGFRTDSSSNGNDHKFRKREKERGKERGGARTGAFDNIKNNAVHHSHHKSLGNGLRSDPRRYDIGTKVASEEPTDSNCKKRKVVRDGHSNGHSNGHHRVEVNNSLPPLGPYGVRLPLIPPPAFMDQFLSDPRHAEMLNRRPDIGLPLLPPFHGSNFGYPLTQRPMGGHTMNRHSIPIRGPFDPSHITGPHYDRLSFPMHGPPASPNVIVPIFVPIPIPVPIPFAIRESLLKNQPFESNNIAESPSTNDQMTPQNIGLRRRSLRSGIECVINKLVTKRKSEVEVGQCDDPVTGQTECDLINDDQKGRVECAYV